MQTEQDFIRNLSKKCERQRDSLIVGIGDDAAVINWPSKSHLVVSSDLLIEDVHFRRRYFPPKFLGHKALAVNLSDMAAMGAIPRFCLLNLAIPSDCNNEFINDLVAGLLTLADKYNVVLIGGDTSSSTEKIYVDVTVLGEITPGKDVRRSGAQVGDLIYVSGQLGKASAGLYLLENNLDQDSLPSIQSLINSHLKPLPQLKLGQYLANKCLATSMMDMSDGLSIDLARLCEASNVGAIIQAASIPISIDVKNISSKFNIDLFELALNGGEDYELLFTVSPQNSLAVESLDFDLKQIGKIIEAEKGLQLEDQSGIHKLEVQGFDHFTRLQSS